LLLRIRKKGLSMGTLRAWLLRLSGLFSKERRDREFNAEMESHLELHIEENLRAGMTHEQARREALMKLGGVEQTKELYRERRGLPVVETFAQDLRYALRVLRKNPGFTSIAVITLALGIAVNATMFSLVSAFLLTPPPVRDPERVVVVSMVNPNPVFQADGFPVSIPNYLAWRKANHVFAGMAAAHAHRTASLTSQGSPAGAGQPEAVRLAAVSPNYFSVLGMSPQIGRTFSEGEDQPGHDHVVILSHDLWERRFGSDLSVLERTIRLNRENYSVIGIMPADFRLLGFTGQLWTPLVLSEADQSTAARNDRSLYVFARLKPEATLEQARAEFATLGLRAQQDFPEIEKGWGTAVRTLPDFLIYDFSIRNGLVVMMTAVGFVLMIACANVAGLLLARAAGRRKELAIRISLGGSRFRIVRQLLTEGLVLSFLGGSMGLLSAYWGIYFLRVNMAFNEAVSAVPLSLDRNVLLFALGVSFASALLCSFAPALKASRTDINANLKDESRAASAGKSHARLRSVFVTGEISLALFLLIGAGLLIRGLFLIERQDLGFHADHLLTAGVTLDNSRYKGASEQVLFVRDVMPLLEHIPGSEAVAAASDLPATGPDSITLRIKGQPELPPNAPAGQRLSALDVVVTAGYFRAAGIPLVRGRTFTEMDNATAPRVVLVNQEFVHRFLKDQEPLGQQIRLDVGSATQEWSEIVGVVGNVKSYSEGTREDPEVYEAFLQRPVPSFSLMVRATPDPSALTSALRSAVAQVDSELPLTRVMSMPALLERQKGGDPLFLRILGTFALLALILAGIGIYGLVAYSVNQRTHEIGIRIALGARNVDVLRMVLWAGVKMTAIGVVIGLVMALPLPKVFGAMFFDLHLSEPRLYFIVPVAMVVVAMLATYIPARRATRVDPMRALRQE
jgi:predicted permease